MTVLMDRIEKLEAEKINWENEYTAKEMDYENLYRDLEKRKKVMKILEAEVKAFKNGVIKFFKFFIQFRQHIVESLL